MPRSLVLLSELSFDTCDGRTSKLMSGHAGCGCLCTVGEGTRDEGVGLRSGKAEWAETVFEQRHISITVAPPTHSASLLLRDLDKRRARFSASTLEGQSSRARHRHSISRACCTSRRHHTEQAEPKQRQVQQCNANHITSNHINGNALLSRAPSSS